MEQQRRKFLLGGRLAALVAVPSVAAVALAKGEKGDTGIPGPQGLDGIPGRDGRTGAMGPPGVSNVEVELGPNDLLVLTAAEDLHEEVASKLRLALEDALTDPERKALVLPAGFQLQILKRP